MYEKGKGGLKAFMQRAFEGKGCMPAGSNGSSTNDSSTNNSWSYAWVGDKQEGWERKPVLLEHKFQVKLEEERVLLSGIMDRVDLVYPKGEGEGSAQVWILDYKARVGKKNLQDMCRGNLQMALYALVYEKLYHKRPEMLMLESIEDGRVGALKYNEGDVLSLLPGKSREIPSVSDILHIVAEGIRAENFRPTPSYQSCRFCSFQSTCPHSQFG